MIASRALLRSVAVVRFRIWLATALAFGALVAGLLLRAGQRRKTARSIRGNRGTLGVHSETEEISNAESEATPHPNTETKNREEEIQREIEVGTKRGDA